MKILSALVLVMFLSPAFAEIQLSDLGMQETTVSPEDAHKQELMIERRSKLEKH